MWVRGKEDACSNRAAHQFWRQPGHRAGGPAPTSGRWSDSQALQVEEVWPAELILKVRRSPARPSEVLYRTATSTNARSPDGGRVENQDPRTSASICKKGLFEEYAAFGRGHGLTASAVRAVSQGARPEVAGGRLARGDQLALSARLRSLRQAGRGVRYGYKDEARPRSSSPLRAAGREPGQGLPRCGWSPTRVLEHALAFGSMTRRVPGLYKAFERRRLHTSRRRDGARSSGAGRRSDLTRRGGDEPRRTRGLAERKRAWSSSVVRRGPVGQQKADAGRHLPAVEGPTLQECACKVERAPDFPSIRIARRGATPRSVGRNGQRRRRAPPWSDAASKPSGVVPATSPATQPWFRRCPPAQVRWTVVQPRAPPSRRDDVAQYPSKRRYRRRA